MLVREVLKSKGSTIYSTSPDETLAGVVEKLVENNCGSLIVLENDAMVGIITERDIMKTLAGQPTALESEKVRDRMTTSLVTGSPDDEVEKVMGLMTQHRIRHFPILEDGKLAGMISIGDVVKANYDLLSMENHYLKSYIQS